MVCLGLVIIICLLGHGDNTFKDEPTLIQALVGKDVIDIECGATYRYLSLFFQIVYYVQTLLIFVIDRFLSLVIL